MQVFNWFLEDKKQETQPTRFAAKVVISPKSTLYVEIQPKDPTSTSNIVVTAFVSQQVRSIVPIRVEWSRFKLKTDSMHSVQKVHCLIGNTYMCQPGDVGGYIRAVIRSVDETIRAEAEVTIGPIGIDVMLKRIIEGALYSGSLLSQVVVCERERKSNINLRLNARTMEFVDEGSQEKLVKDYTMSEPKIQLNPKDPTRLYLRFQQDQGNAVRDWLNSIFNYNNPNAQESFISNKVPYSVHSSNSSKMRLFQKSHGPCINKMQLKFISRHSRDLFLFTQRVFVCKQDMKNSIYIQRIQSLQNIATQQDYHTFLQYMSLKYQICRLADYAKEVEEDRDSKVRDLVTMEESIGEMTMTYLKIIEEKGKHEHVDFQHSYSQISIAREDIMTRKNVRELKTQNQNLKKRLLELNQQIELLQFFKKDDNQSMIFNQTSNPFGRKPQDLSVSYQVNGLSPEGKSHRQNMYQMSINYANLLQQNRQLKGQMGFSKKPVNKLDRSQNMMELLGSLDQRQQKQIKFVENQRIIAILRKQNQQFKSKIDTLMQQNNNRSPNVIVSTPSKSFINLQPSINNSLLNQSNTSALTDSFLNQSVTSQAAIMKLQQNLRSISALNTRLQEDTTRLRRQRDYYRTEVNKLQAHLKELQGKKSAEKISNFNLDDSMMVRYKEQNQNLQNQRNALIRKVQSLSRQNGQGIKEQLLQRERKNKELEQTIEGLRNENQRLQRQGSSGKGDKDTYLAENLRLKKANSQLLEQIKNIKIELEKKNSQDMYSSRVIELQNQLLFAKGAQDQSDGTQNKQMMQQINELSKANAKLRQQNQDKQTKLEHQAVTIQKLMTESSKINNSPPPKQNPSLSSTSTKQKCYSQRCNQPTVQEIQKYKRQIKKLQQQIIFMKRSADAINRSRDLSMDMDGYYQEKMDVMKREMEALYVQNQNLSKMCERYGRDARQANKQLNKWREKAMNLMKAKTEQHSLLSNQ